MVSLTLGLTLLVLGEFPQSAGDKALAATVRVDNAADDVRGSGVVFARSGPHVYLLTAEHVVPKAAVVEVTVASGKSFKADVLARSPQADLAVLRAPAAGFPAPIELAPRKAVAKQAASVGWEAGDDPTLASEIVTGPVRLKRPGATGTVQCWETARKPVVGRSGGPLVDETGRVVGIAAGHDGATGYYVHGDEVHAFLKTNALGWLVEGGR